MKVLRLHLQAFGPFTDVALDLSAGHHGLHLVYGPNEAGKSSALRALRQMFYGIPAQTPDDFIHPYPRLRIGALVRHSDGTELGLVRRKGNKNTLRNAADDSPVSDAHLGRFLGNLDKELFETMFGIDHEALVEGGRQIAEGGGHFGEMLFAASAGLAGLRGAQASLKRDADELFLPQGQNPRINKTLTAFRTAQVEVRNLQLSSEEWRRHEQAFQKAQEEHDRLQKDWQKQNRELNRLTRIRDALPQIAERKQLLAELEGCRGAVLLPDDFAEQRRAETTALLQAQRDAKQAREEETAVEERLGRLDVPEALLSHAEAVSALYQRLGEYRKNLLDLPMRDVQKKNLEHDAKEVLQSLGRPRELDQAEHLRLRRGEALEIQNLGNRQQALLVQREAATKAVEDLNRGLARLRQGLEDGALPDATGLRAAVRQAQALGPVERDLDAERSARQQAERQAAIEMARLPHWSGALADLERLAAPLPESLDRFEKELHEVQNRLQALEARAREEEAAVQKLDAELRQLELQQAVPTEDDLQEARRRRDEGWRLVRQAWRDGHSDAATIAAFVKGLAPARDLAEAYESSAQRADELADRLRREAERVATKASLLAQRDQHHRRFGKLAREREDMAARHVRLTRGWEAEAQSLPLPGRAPAEVRSWLRLQNNLVRQAQALREKDDRLALLRKTIAASSAHLGGCLERLGETAPRADEALAGLLERGQSVLDRMDEERRRREQTTKEIADREEKLSAARARAAQAEEELARWQQEWATATGRLGLEKTARPEAANAFLAGITELFQKLHEADGFRRRIEGMKRDMGSFEKDVQGLVQRVAPDLAALPADRAAAELYLRLGEGRRDQQEREALRTARDKAARKLQTAKKEEERALASLEARRQEAGGASIDDLPQAESRSALRLRLETALGQCDARLRAFSAGAPVEELVAEAEQIDADLLKDQIDALEKQIGTLQGEIAVVNQTVGAERKELEQMDGSASAAEAAENAEALLAQLHADVPHYAALRLAAVVLQKGIERYREKNQGPVLVGASRRFADLTCGSFERLRIDCNDDGDAVLVGVRPGGQDTVGVEGMSDGCRDQLYLALRLASLEAWLENHEPIPFTVDDVLLNFDDDRAAAALRSLAELSRRTQVVFFTHHEHVGELAKCCLPDDVLFTHRLPGRSTHRAVARVV